ncbi:ImuA family protein [Lutibaculum baratangense]|uniref:Error-prone repair protein ImuA n=1 Tax=Lutibaculum baratangense AMV1 TaxID=631454 RepID=V4RJ33_9HYPH|nr:hypothetical protein [Lutibaculum baratangense]ESR26096.1 hypothetical protein N177_1431 [Lutibaculum baratangense AMV1]
MPAVRIENLRETIAHLEAPAAAEARPPRPLGVEPLDRVLGGGLQAGALHEVRAEGADAPSSFGFALALAIRLCPPPLPLLHVTLPHVGGEWGRPYGPGLSAFGLDPGRILFVEAKRPSDALWAAEEGLFCAALGAVVLEIPGEPAAVDLTATRRLSLRAARHGVSALLVRPGGGGEATAATTRWQVAPLAGPADPSFVLPPPAWRARLERNRGGRGGSWSLSWRPDVLSFAPHATLSVASSATSADRAAAAGPRRRAV